MDSTGGAAYQAVYPWAQNASGNRFTCPDTIPCCIQNTGACNHTSANLPAQESLLFCDNNVSAGQPPLKQQTGCGFPTWATVLIVVGCCMVALLVVAGMSLLALPSICNDHLSASAFAHGLAGITVARVNVA